LCVYVPFVCICCSDILYSHILSSPDPVNMATQVKQQPGDYFLSLYLIASINYNGADVLSAFNRELQGARGLVCLKIKSLIVYACGDMENLYRNIQKDVDAARADPDVARKIIEFLKSLPYDPVRCMSGNRKCMIAG